MFLTDLQKLKIIEEDFCGMDVNTPLGGEKPIGKSDLLSNCFF